MRKIRVCILTAIFVFALALTAYAAERLKETYNEDSGEYRYSLDKDNYVTSSKQLGRIVEGAVKLDYGSDVEVSLEKNGKAAEITSGGIVFEEGNYVLTVSDGEERASVNFMIKKTDADLDSENVFYSISPVEQSYSAKDGMYHMSVGGRYTFRCNVPNLCITDRPVKVYMPSDEKLDVKVYKNGGEISFSSGKTFYEPGYYVFENVYEIAEDEELTDEEIMSDASEEEKTALAGDDITDEEIAALAENGDGTDGEENLGIADVSKFSFCITDGPQSAVGIISPPQDHIIASVTLDGKKTETDKNFFKAEKDGNYRIVFRNEAGKLPDRTFAFTRDTMPPTLDFENVGSGGIARGNFHIIKKDKGCNVEIYKNGELRDDLPDTIEEEGLYRIIASDDAGNSRVYMIRLKKGYEVYIFYFTAAILAAAVGIWLYSSYIGKNIHIR